MQECHFKGGVNMTKFITSLDFIHGEIEAAKRRLEMLEIVRETLSGAYKVWLVEDRRKEGEES